jgi:hypothetical protein
MESIGPYVLAAPRLWLLLMILIGVLFSSNYLIESAAPLSVSLLILAPTLRVDRVAIKLTTYRTWYVQGNKTQTF